MGSPFYSAQPYAKKQRPRWLQPTTGISLVLSCLLICIFSFWRLFVSTLGLSSAVYGIHHCFGFVFTESGSRNFAKSGSNTDPDPGQDLSTSKITYIIKNRHICLWNPLNDVQALQTLCRYSESIWYMHCFGPGFTESGSKHYTQSGSRHLLNPDLGIIQNPDPGFCRIWILSESEYRA